MSEMTRELMTLGDSQSKALELADGSYGMGKVPANLVVSVDVGCGWEDLTELMACYIHLIWVLQMLHCCSTDVIRWVDPVHQFQPRFPVAASHSLPGSRKRTLKPRL